MRLSLSTSICIIAVMVTFASGIMASHLNDIVTNKEKDQSNTPEINPHFEPIIEHNTINTPPKKKTSRIQHVLDQQNQPKPNRRTPSYAGYRRHSAPAVLHQSLHELTQDEPSPMAICMKYMENTVIHVQLFYRAVLRGCSMGIPAENQETCQEICQEEHHVFDEQETKVCVLACDYARRVGK